jgi:hypothetical protein
LSFVLLEDVALLFVRNVDEHVAGAHRVTQIVVDFEHAAFDFGADDHFIIRKQSANRVHYALDLTSQTGPRGQESDRYPAWL